MVEIKGMRYSFRLGIIRVISRSVRPCSRGIRQKTEESTKLEFRNKLKVLNSKSFKQWNFKIGICFVLRN
jgi:hypothetical protein